MSKKNVMISIDSDLHEQVKAWAASRNSTVSALLSAAVRICMRLPAAEAPALITPSEMGRLKGQPSKPERAILAVLQEAQAEGLPRVGSLEIAKLAGLSHLNTERSLQSLRLRRSVFYFGHGWKQYPGRTRHQTHWGLVPCTTLVRELISGWKTGGAHESLMFDMIERVRGLCKESIDPMDLHIITRELSEATGLNPRALDLLSGNGAQEPTRRPIRAYVPPIPPPPPVTE